MLVASTNGYMPQFFNRATQSNPHSLETLYAHYAPLALSPPSPTFTLPYDPNRTWSMRATT